MFSFPPFEEIIWKYDYLFIYLFIFFSSSSRKSRMKKYALSRGQEKGEKFRNGREVALGAEITKSH